MSNLVVVNASPVIGLLAIGREGLLPALFSKILVPMAVREEILAGAAKDSNAERLGDCDWAVSPPDETMPETVLAWGLGRGESSVLAMAHRLGAMAILDDLAARRCARFLDVPLSGTGRILVLAKDRGLIQSVANECRSLRASGFRLSDRLIARLLSDAGEA